MAAYARADISNSHKHRTFLLAHRRITLRNKTIVLGAAARYSQQLTRSSIPNRRRQRGGDDGGAILSSRGHDHDPANTT
jgi:hypothetical protein